MAASEFSAQRAEFWHARSVLGNIFDFALAYRASPWAVLGAVLAQVVAATPPFVVLPALIGDVASLNLFEALVGASGGGKGAAEATATRYLDFNNTVPPPFSIHQPGSGQGLAHAYGHIEKRGGPPRLVRHEIAALFTIAEADVLRGLFGQQGSTLLPELRSLAMGEPLGHLYADPEKRIEIAAHSYRACLVVGVQPERAGVLLDDVAGGTPQRFIWLPSTYAGHPETRPPEPARMHWNQPDFATSGGKYYIMPVCSIAAEEVDKAHLARQRGEGDALDGHLLLTKEKVAAALALLDGRAEVTTEDWQLATVVMDVSQATRLAVQETIKAITEREHQSRVQRRVSTERALQNDRIRRSFVAAQRQAVNHVGRDKCGGCKKRCITIGIAGDYRSGVSVDEVLSDAVARDYLHLDASSGVYTIGGGTP